MAALILSAFVIMFVGLLYLVYDGYLRCLRVVAHFAARSERLATPADGQLPSIAVLITVHDEAHQIVERIQNVLDQDYPRELLDVVIASDGSTDGLRDVVAEQFGDDVRVVHSDRKVGKSIIQNQAIESIRSSIVLFSDADTRFAPDFLRALAAPFAIESVGAVQAHLLFVPADPTSAVVGQARYWRAELEIRRLEARLGILAVASGSCIAMRRELWLPLDPRFGEDCIIPLDVVAQSRTVAYAESAIAYEPADKEFDNVIATRARMTLRNWQGTWSRPELLNPFTNPGHAVALWSHKLLRWLSPVWLIGLTVAAVALPFASSRRLFLVPGGAVLAFSLLAVAGGIARWRSRHLPVCSAVYAFVLANLGFLSGLAKAARGHTMTSYRSSR